MTKPAELAALEEIKNYIVNQNRPYSVNDVFENLHKTNGKTLVGKCMDTLVERSVLHEKLFGKQKIYFPNQDQFPSCSEEELLSLDVEIKDKIAEMKQLQSSIHQLEAELKLAVNSLTTEQIVAKIESTKIEITKSKEKLEKLRESAEIISLDEKEKICKSYDNNVKQWRNRKRMASSILDTILESWPKKKKDLLEEIGIETDEDYKVECP